MIDVTETKLKGREKFYFGEVSRKISGVVTGRAREGVLLGEEWKEVTLLRILAK